MGEVYDVVVVGARCAGASTALLLARAGYRVLVLERARFPSDTLSTLYIHQPGVARLARWGVLAEIVGSGCPPLDHAVYRAAGVCLEGCAPAVDGIRAAYAPRRQVLDTVLAQAAVASGAELRNGCAVVGLEVDDRADDRRVLGVRYRTPGGKLATARARLTVGADGMRSLVARLVGAHQYAVHRRLTCALYTYWGDIRTAFELYERPGRWVAAIPTNEQLTLVVVYFPQDEIGAIGTHGRGSYMETIRSTSPQLHERILSGRQADRFYGTGDQQNFFRQASGAGWVLIGDAGHHKDSLTALGIADAFMQADLLLDCLTRCGAASPSDLEDPRRIRLELQRFERERNRLLEPGYQTTLSVAQLDLSPERLILLRAMQHSPDLTERYFGAVAGMITPQELFTPDLLALLLPTRRPLQSTTDCT
jgi:2-polyprenyl-6-methoxyphenol hydroxylase-like FAD-dependent oxidoreductase